MLPNPPAKLAAPGHHISNAYINWYDSTPKDQLIATCPRPDWLLAILFRDGMSRYKIVALALLCVKNVRRANEEPCIGYGLSLAEKCAAGHTDAGTEEIIAAVKSCRQCAKSSQNYDVYNRPNTSRAWAADAVASILQACVQQQDSRFIRHIQEAVRASVSAHLLLGGNIAIYGAYCNNIRNAL